MSAPTHRVDRLNNAAIYASVNPVYLANAAERQRDDEEICYEVMPWP